MSPWQSKTILAVDTSQNRGQIVLWKDKGIAAEVTWEKAKSHSEKITSAFNTLISQAKSDLNDIQAIACVVGPGSFTGIRVGVNFCKSLAYSIQSPMISINSLDLLALNGAETKNKIVACLDAQKNSVFLSIYNNDFSRVFQNKVVPIQRLNEVIKEPVFVCGPGLMHYSEYIDAEVLSFCRRDQESLGSDLKKVFSTSSIIDLNQEVSWDQLNPLYIKASAPEEKLHPTIM